MIETRSALEKLAERITEVLAYYQDDMYLEHRQTLDMAQRIVAELANANKTYIDDCVNNSIVDLAYEALRNCRAIAEEGCSK